MWKPSGSGEKSKENLPRDDDTFQNKPGESKKEESEVLRRQLEEKLQISQTEKQNLERKIEEIREQQKQTETENQDLKRTLQDVQEQYDKVLKVIKNLERQIVELTQQHENDEAANQELLNQINQMNTSLQDLSSESKQTKAELGRRLYLPRTDDFTLNKGHQTIFPPVQYGLPCTLTILVDKLYVAFDGNPNILIYHVDTFVFFSQFQVPNLLDPGDIKSCEKKNQLFIVDWKTPDEDDEILILDTNGQVKNRWRTMNDECRLSVSDESTLVVTYYFNNKIQEYAANGDGPWMPITKIQVNVSAPFPWHAVKLISGHFAVCHGKVNSQEHRVCVINEDGSKLKLVSGEDIQLSDIPAYLALHSDGSAIVAYQKSGNVFLLNTSLEKTSTLLTSDDGLGIVRNLCLNKRNPQLLLVECRQTWQNGRILIYDIIPH